MEHKKRVEQANDWLRDVVRARFGSAGCDVLGDACSVTDEMGPFGRARELLANLQVVQRT